MVRKQADPEIPYITVEIDAKRGSIIQWYGAHDQKPDKKAMQKWLNEYVMELKNREIKTMEMQKNIRIQVAV